MSYFFELFPIILFFIAFKIKGIYFATAVGIIASIAQIAVAALRKKKIEPMMWISLAVMLIFGGSALLFRNELFIKWKPTVLYWIFALIILGTKFISKKNIMKLIMQSKITLPELAWNVLNISWGIFFLLLGGINLFVAYHFSTDTWVNFKLFGVMGCMLIFVIFQSIAISYLMRNEPELPNIK